MAREPKQRPAKRAPKRRDLTRTPQTGVELDAAARITTEDIQHAAGTWRKLAPPAQRSMLQAPLYTGDPMPSDADREP